VYVLSIVVCPFVLFLLAIVLSVLLRCTDSDYSFVLSKQIQHVHYMYYPISCHSVLCRDSLEEGYTEDNWFPITNYYNDAYSPLDDISQYDYQLPL